MPALNWSMSIVGYRQHQRSGSAVVGVSHMSTHEVLRFAEEMNFYTGWLLAQGSQPQLERVRQGKPQWVALAEMFADRRVVMTDGLASGSLVFVAAVQAHGQPPTDRTLIAWADAQRIPWVEVIDNEIAYWGGLLDTQVERLLTWFSCQRPIERDWRQTAFAGGLGPRLRKGLFEHGWTRNLELVKTGRKPSQDWWGGVHGSSILEHAQSPRPSQAHAGVRLGLVGSEWEGKDLGERCILNDENGKLPLGR